MKCLEKLIQEYVPDDNTIRNKRTKCSNIMLQGHMFIDTNILSDPPL